MPISVRYLNSNVAVGFIRRYDQTATATLEM